MEYFESKALESAPLKPKLWKIFVDDAFIIWPYGIDALEAFKQHLNNLSSSIKFTMELETNESLPFLDILISRNPDDSIFHQVYCKKKPTQNSVSMPLLATTPTKN